MSEIESKITMVMVSSVNGKITRGDEGGASSWASRDDQEHFFSLLEKHKVIIMGADTYCEAKSIMKLTPERKRMVLTSTPGKYLEEQVPGQLEFTNENPNDLVKRLRNEGHNDMLLVGGGYTNASFLKAGLVDEIQLTVEPYLFGKGINLVAEENVDVPLTLLDCKQINPHGTLLLKYGVEK